MAYKKETWQLLNEIIQTIDKTIIVDSVDDLGSGVYKINICNSLWVTLGTILTIDSVEFTVTEIDPNNYIKATGPSLPVAQMFEINLPFFIHGTVLATQAELAAKTNSKEKLPFIYLHEITEEEFNSDDLLTLERTSNCDLYFMVDCNFQDWNTNDHYNLAIRPMRNMLFGFINALEKAKNVDFSGNYKVYDHARFGVYQNDKGHLKRIFTEMLSGSQLKINIPFLKMQNNCTNCD